MRRGGTNKQRPMNNISSTDSAYVTTRLTNFHRLRRAALPAFGALCCGPLIIWLINSLHGDGEAVGLAIVIALLASVLAFVAWKVWKARELTALAMDPTGALTPAAIEEKARLEKVRVAQSESLKSSSGSSADSDSAILFIFFWLPLICGLLYLLFTSAPWWAAVIILLLLFIVLS